MNLSKRNTLIREAVILAGGLGTRLRDTVPDLPKCMAPVAGHPFLFYVIRYLRSAGITRFVFSLGYKHEAVEAFLQDELANLDYACVIENQPLMTGGALKLALGATRADQVLVLNGDTMFKADLHALGDLHQSVQAECTLALKPMHHFDRYGAVVTAEDGRILAFSEKKHVDAGNINAGVYVLDKKRFLAMLWPEVFSFEKDYLERYAETKKFYGVIQDAYFMDIGVPADYLRAQHEFQYISFPFEHLDASWTLFLDRDGVININKPESYVFHRGEFIFTEGALEAICALSDMFGRIIVVTNQRGVGKGLMTLDALQDIHDYMIDKVEKTCGRIDDIFYCISPDDAHPDRKPSPGMAHKAKVKYPEIDFSKSIMVGDKAVDMQWGKNIGALTVWITSETYKHSVDPSIVDLACNSLAEFAHLLKINRQ